MRKIFLWAVVVFLFFSSGCGGGDASKEVSPKPSAQETSEIDAGKKSIDVSTVGLIKGRVLFEGDAPAPKAISVKGNPECAILHPGGNVMSEELLAKDGGLGNVFMYVKEGLEGYTFETPKEPVTIENNACVYAPHVAGAQVNQEIIFLNKDNTLHNIHSYPKTNKAFNLGLPLVGMKQTKKFAAAEIMVPMKCDVHPWMLGYIGVLSHPCFAVTDVTGNFELKNLPPGEYLIEAWHEKLGVQSQRVKIEPKSEEQVEFRFKSA